MKRIVTNLWFDDQAEEAANFYISLVGGKITNTMLLTESIVEATGKALGSVLTVDFELLGQNFIGLNGGPENFKFNEAVSILVECESQDEIDMLWDKLGEGGEPGVCGWLKDKYGLSWQIVPASLDVMMRDPDSIKANNVATAMMQMKKLNIAELEAAFNK